MPNEKEYASSGGSYDYAKAIAEPKADRIVSTRESVLTEATKLTCGDRNAAYGPPFENLNRIANLFKAYMGNRPLSSLTAADVAAFNVLTKLSRVTTNPTHRDSWVDAAAYAAIGLECAVTGLLSVKQEG